MCRSGRANGSRLHANRKRPHGNEGEGQHPGKIGKPTRPKHARNAIQGLDPQTRKRSKGNVFLGLAVDEYVEDFQWGDFLVRNLLASSEPRGSLAVGAFPRVGQTAQFQIRDRAGASEVLELLLARSKEELRVKRVFGACLSDC